MEMKETKMKKKGERKNKVKRVRVKEPPLS
jgi:hypothetical protein